MIPNNDEFDEHDGPDYSKGLDNGGFVVGFFLVAIDLPLIGVLYCWITS